MRFAIALIFSLVSALPVFGAGRYHLELEANPAAAFPWLGRFGAVEVHVYPSGVRAEALWLNAFSKNGAPAITVANPLGRMYVDVPLGDVTSVLRKLAGGNTEASAIAAPLPGPVMRGTVHGIAATRHRLVYGPAAWIDVWTTNAVPENPQLRRVVDQIVAGVSPATASAVRAVPGTPIYVELNFRRFNKVPLLRVKELTFDTSAAAEKDALELGALYVRAPLLDKLLQ